MPTSAITLQQAADELGVHYMTAYRYVKLGLLYAEKRKGSWTIAPADLDAFRATQGRTNGTTNGDGAPSPASGPVEELRDSVEAALIDGDEAAAWAIVEPAATSADAIDVHLEVLAPALVSIGRRWEAGELSIADEHKASAVATRVIARLGALLTTPGRRRGTVIVGACPGDVHSIPSAMFADVLRTHGVTVIDLGGSPGVEAYLEAVDRHPEAVVAISLTGPGHVETATATVDAIRERTHGETPIAVGGGAIPRQDIATAIGADLWHADHRAAAQLIAETAADRRSASRRSR